MSRQNETLFFYTVRLMARDPAEMLHGALYRARRTFWENGRRGHLNEKEPYSGLPCRTAGTVARRHLKWQRQIGGVLREEAFPFEKGHALLLRDENGALIGRIVYGRRQEWLRSAYLTPGETEPQVILQPGTENGTLLMLTRKKNGQYQKRTLYPSPYAPGTLTQSVINGRLGEPVVIAATNQGDFGYTGREESGQRRQLTQDIARGTVSALPKWQAPLEEPEENTADPREKAEKMYQDLSFLLDEASQKLPPLPVPVPPETDTKTALPQDPPEELPAVTLQEESPKPGSTGEEKDGEALLPEENGSEEEDPTDSTADAPAAATGEPDPLSAILPQPDSSPQPSSSGRRYRVALKPLNGEVQYLEKRPAPAAARPHVAVSAQESYLYFGEMLEGLRHGRGRTQQENGFTAYEGTYKNNQRDGWGAYYYRSGEPCYVGSFRENKRDGIGVTFRDQEHWIHVGSWHEDVPGGVSSLFNEKGDLLYAGVIENGKKQGAGAVLQGENGQMFVGKWKDNQPTGEGSVFDREGNLLYTGSWKEGKREGEGTSFDKQGRVVFTGIWRQDRYFTGLQLRRLEEGCDVSAPERDG